MDDKLKIFSKTETLLRQHGFTIVKKDMDRPWGGFFVIDEDQAVKFASFYFPEENINEIMMAGKLSPKILVIAPHLRLSWQYHNRRAEIWTCIGNEVAISTSNTDHEDVKHIMHKGDIIKLKQGERHRLIGLDNWGLIAEIWQHTDAHNPSDEDDIVRLQDDFSRK